MAKTSESEKFTPAYVPFETFRNFIESLHQTAIPPSHIEKTQMRNLSGGTQSHLMLALRFLGLIEKNDEVTEKMRDLVKSFGKQETWTTALREVILSAYSPILCGLDIQTVPEGRFYDAFRAKTTFEGSVLERAIRFCIKALQEAKVPLSPYLGQRKKRTVGKRTNGKVKSNTDGATGEHSAQRPNDGGGERGESEAQIPPGMMKIPIYAPGKPQGCIIVHEDLNEADCTMISAILLAYAKRRAEGR